MPARNNVLGYSFTVARKGNCLQGLPNVSIKAEAAGKEGKGGEGQGTGNLGFPRVTVVSRCVEQKDHQKPLAGNLPR